MQKNQKRQTVDVPKAPKQKNPALQVFAHNAKRLRILAGFSQQGAADEFGCEKAYISQLENQRVGVGPKQLLKLAEIYGCHEVDFYRPIGYPDETLVPIIAMEDLPLFAEQSLDAFEDRGKILGHRLTLKPSNRKLSESVWIQITKEELCGGSFRMADLLHLTKTTEISNGDLVAGRIGDRYFLGYYSETDGSIAIRPDAPKQPVIIIGVKQAVLEGMHLFLVLDMQRVIKNDIQGG